VEIKVLSSLATREAYLELVPQFEQSSGHKVATSWAGTTDIMKRMAAGEIYDLVVSSQIARRPHQARQDRRGRPVILAKCGIGIAVEPTPRPDVGSPEAFKQAVLTAKTVKLFTGPSSVYRRAVRRMGIGEAVNQDQAVASA
jgi:molybdate transport system substrate-binding protein